MELTLPFHSWTITLSILSTTLIQTSSGQHQFGLSIPHHHLCCINLVMLHHRYPHLIRTGSSLYNISVISLLNTPYKRTGNHWLPWFGCPLLLRYLHPYMIYDILRVLVCFLSVRLALARWLVHQERNHFLSKLLIDFGSNVRTLNGSGLAYKIISNTRFFF